MRIRVLYFLPCLVIFFMSCNNSGKDQNNNVDQVFQKLSGDFLKGYLAWRPQAAVALGLHDYDGRLSDFSKPSLDSELRRLKEYDQDLANIDTASLSKNMFYDYRILTLAIKNEIFNFENL